MKTKAKPKATAKKRIAARPSVELYAVSWADYDENIERMFCGMLSNIFSTKEKARKQILELTEAAAQEDMEAYDEKDWMEVFGTTDPKKLAKKMIVRDQGDYIVVRRGEQAVESHYSIQKYDTKYMDMDLD